MVERTPERRIVFVKVEDLKRPTLKMLLLKYVHPESIIHSDCWKAYSNLCALFAEHRTVNHSLHFFDPETLVHTNRIEGNWSGVKEQVSNTHKTKEHVDVYLIRYMIRKNSPDSALESLLNLNIYY
ncbi:hypothetical protein ENBRE01_2094 [Enteropsectra breve]|nr:hypothetical protein ENBRE01_2094 [Enteropsectra breve]